MDVKIENTLANAWVQSWDQYVGTDGAIAIMNALDAAGYKIVRKDETEQMLERVKNLGNKIDTELKR